MQLKTLDGYSQIGVESKQPTAPPPTRFTSIGGGYVPHQSLTPPTSSPAPVMMSPQKTLPPITKSTPKLTKPQDSVGSMSKSSLESQSPCQSTQLSPMKSSVESNDDDDDDCENSEYISSEPLVDLPNSTSSDDDFIVIGKIKIARKI